MPYFLVRDFSSGVDLRKSTVSAEAGTLRTLRNAFVNAGGEIEKRKAFSFVTELAPGSYGLAATGGELWVFGSGESPGVPAGLNYQRLTNASPIRAIRDAETFDGRLYVISETVFGTFEHFYDGARVTPNTENAFAARVHRSKVYVVSANRIGFSALNNPADWSGTGSGFIQLDTQDAGSWSLVGIDTYYDQLALFGRQGIQLWTMDEDPERNQIIQTLGNIGLVATQATTRYGSGDVLFLHDSGIRSLRARDSSNSASVTDIGAPVDDLVRERLLDPESNTATSLNRVAARVDPNTGQVWFAWEGKIYVLSIAPATRVSAWSVFEPGFSVEYIAVSNGRLYLRSGNSVFLYGGANNTVYDDSEAEVVLPMLSANTPATDKMWMGFDAAVEGAWTVEVGTDPSRPDVRERVADIAGPTFSLQKIGLQNAGTHISVRMRSTSAMRARIGQIVLHYEGGDAG